MQRALAFAFPFVVAGASCTPPRPPAVVKSPRALATRSAEAIPETVTSEQELSLAAVAPKVYAAVAAREWEKARTLLGSLRESRCYGEPRVRGPFVAGPRAILKLGADGAIETHRIVAGCVVYADATLDVIDEEQGTRFAENGVSELLARTEPSASDVDRVFVSDAWALAIDSTGDYLALDRRAGTTRRGHSSAASRQDSSILRSAVGGQVVGDVLVLDDDMGLSLTRAEGAAVRVRGCAGVLLAAAGSKAREVAIHVASLRRPGIEESNTRLCFVRADGTTRQVVQLGSATCGLARAMPCEWQLQASTPSMLGFGSMRGAFRLLDATSGRVLVVPLPAGAHPDGGSPGGFFSCARDLCVSYADGQDRPGSSRLSWHDGVVRATTFVHIEEASWCALAGLPVPREVCASPELSTP